MAEARAEGRWADLAFPVASLRVQTLCAQAAQLWGLQPIDTAPATPAAPTPTAAAPPPPAAGEVSYLLALLACIGSPCLRHRVHGAPIGECYGQLGRLGLVQGRCSAEGWGGGGGGSGAAHTADEHPLKRAPLAGAVSAVGRGLWPPHRCRFAAAPGSNKDDDDHDDTAATTAHATADADAVVVASQCTGPDQTCNVGGWWQPPPPPAAATAAVEHAHYHPGSAR
jgi:hypothetical protein